MLKQGGIVDGDELLKLTDELVGFEKGSIALDNRYKFFQKPEYQEIRKFYIESLGRDISLSDRIGEGQNALILKHPTKNDKVIKVAKDGEVDDLKKEFESHNKFYDTLMDGRDDFPGELSETIQIPSVAKGKGENFTYFEMDVIDGQSFKSEFIEKNILVN